MCVLTAWEQPGPASDSGCTHCKNVLVSQSMTSCHGYLDNGPCHNLTGKDSDGNKVQLCATQSVACKPCKHGQFDIRWEKGMCTMRVRCILQM